MFMFDKLLVQVAALSGCALIDERRLPNYLAHYTRLLSLAKNQTLQIYREVTAEILEDDGQLAASLLLGARSWILRL
jgi:hypothetical protein